MYRLFSWGANSHGQLGHGDVNEQVVTPKEVDLSFANIEISKIKKIVGGAGHSIILDEYGGIFSCGWNGRGQSGCTEQKSLRFKRLESFGGQKIVDVACGWDSSMALTDQGELFAWGSNFHGQLGLPRVKSTSTPTRVELEVPIEKMSIGLRHSAIVTRDSKVLVSGAATKGQLGVDLDGARTCDRFIEVPELHDISGVSCGQHHTIVTTRNGEIFSWGDNKHGQLGVDPQICKTASSPMKILNDTPADVTRKIYCGWTHSAILTSGAQLLFWGRNTYGQLGRTKTTPKEELWKAKSPTTLIQAQQLSLGSEHNILLTGDGTVMSWGWNEHGNCGNGYTEDTFEPTKVLLPDCTGVLVGAGAGHSFVIVKMKTNK
ncbi:secretion-regulating guanine nucleotide exchange factor [Copidosoma floridanum]|uniref:secretion-regulating guanine nucleotide exchange factor n=1 Tax=Copidosoma floridanum TaxID=29053 RepID=UPI0006C94923|nr:secretion-regulating guanine nucleotide exchange factor [Copidosoma floridanum]